jgi:cellulose synthase/poly-beta-1,6-N-acetylglucosamine synthase-like glycosyltransferase
MSGLSLSVKIIEDLLILYFSTYLLIDMSLFAGALFFFRRRNKPASITDFSSHSVSIIVPAYNEEVSIVDCVRLLTKLDYPNYRVVVVNDGSKDNTLKVMLDSFKWESERLDLPSPLLKTHQIRSVRSSSDGMLMLIDKENGGKADSINAGINISDSEFLCTVDADSILDASALRLAVEPLISDPDVFVSGGQLAVSNGLLLEQNRVVGSKMPRKLLVLWQIIEYIKSFMVSRLGFSKLGSLLIMSGAFSLYRRSDLVSVGGFLTAINDHPYISSTVGVGKRTLCEDMEVVVRLKRFLIENKRKASTRFLPAPICWTEVPDKKKSLIRQRSRWHTGLAETLRYHRGMLFEPKYGITGLFALPYYLLFELFAPLIKLLALLFLVIASALGLINTSWVLLMLLSVTILAAFITSSVTAVIERWSMIHSGANREALRYKTLGDWLILIGAGIISDFSFAFLRMWAQLKGLADFVRSRSEWNKFERRGLQKST